MFKPVKPELVVVVVAAVEPNPVERGKEMCHMTSNHAFQQQVPLVLYLHVNQLHVKWHAEVNSHFFIF